MFMTYRNGVLAILMTALIFSSIFSISVDAKKIKKPIEICVNNDTSKTLQVNMYVGSGKIAEVVLEENKQECKFSGDKEIGKEYRTRISWWIYPNGDDIHREEKPVYHGSNGATADFSIKEDRGTLDLTIKKSTTNLKDDYTVSLYLDDDKKFTKYLPMEDKDMRYDRKLTPGNHKIKIEWKNKRTEKTGTENANVNIEVDKTSTQSIEINDGSKENTAPSFEISGPFSEEPGKQINFNLKATDPDGDPVEYSTKSQYCTTQKGGQTSCKFSSEGTYKEMFSAKDNKNNEAYLEVTFQIKKSLPPPEPPKNPKIVEASWSKNEIKEGEIIDLKVTTSDTQDGKDVSMEIYGSQGLTETKNGKIKNNYFSTSWTPVLGGYDDESFYFKAKVDESGSKDSESLNVLSTKEQLEALKELDNILSSGSVFIILPKNTALQQSPEIVKLKEDIDKKYGVNVIIGKPELTGNKINDKKVSDRNLIIIDSENNYFYQKYIKDKFNTSGSSVKITKNPAQDSKRKSILLRGLNSVTGLRLAIQGGQNKKWGFKEALVSCLWTDDETPLGGDVINFGCNIMPIVELGPDAVDTYKCLTDGNKDNWDQVFCYLTYIGSTVDVSGYAGSIFTLGIAGGVAEAVDVYIQVIRKAAKLAKSEGLDPKIADDVWKFVKVSKDNIVKLGKGLYKIGSDKEAIKDLFKFVSKFGGDKNLISDAFEVLNKNPQTGKSVIKRASTFEKEGSETAKNAVKIGKLVSDFKAAVNIDIVSGDDIKKIVELFEDGKFGQKLARVSKEYKVEEKLKEITFVNVVGDNPNAIAGIELKEGIPTGRMLIKASIYDVGDLKLRTLQHELSHLAADSRIAEISSKLGKRVSDIFPDAISTGKFDEFNEYLADSLYKGKINDVDVQEFEKQVNKIFDNTNYDTFGKAFNEFLSTGSIETSNGKTLKPIRVSALANGMGRSDHVEKIREAVRKHYPYKTDEKGKLEAVQKFDDMVTSFIKLRDEIDQKLLSESAQKLSKSELEKVTKEVRDKADDFINNNGVLTEVKKGRVILTPPINSIPKQTLANLEDKPNNWIKGHVSSSQGLESASFRGGKLWLTAAWSTTALTVYNQKFTNLDVEGDIVAVSSGYMRDHIQPGIILRSSDPIPQKKTTGGWVRSRGRWIWQSRVVDNGNFIDSFIKVGYSTRGDTIDISHSNDKARGGISVKYNFDVGKKYRIKVGLVDDIISVWVDGKQVVNNYKMAKGTYLSSGYAGFAVQGSETATLDNFAITTY